MARLAAGRTTNGRTVCIFERGGQKLALPVWAIREVLSGETASAVPAAPPNVAGAINLRGEPLTLVQIDDWIGVHARPYRMADHILVFECDELRAGLLVDRVHDIRQCEHPLEELPALAGAASPLAARQWSVNGAPVAVLDPHELVARLAAASQASFARIPSAPRHEVGHRGVSPTER